MLVPTPLFFFKKKKIICLNYRPVYFFFELIIKIHIYITLILYKLEIKSFRSVNLERGIVPLGEMASGHRPVYDTRPKSDLSNFTMCLSLSSLNNLN